MSIINEPLKLKNEKSLIELWINLNSINKYWDSLYQNFIETKNISDIKNPIEYSKNMAIFLQDCPVERWISLFDGEGWNNLSCTLLSWCKGANIKHSITRWSQLKLISPIRPYEDFSACLLNEKLLPSLTMSSLLETSGESVYGMSLLIAARAEAPQFDYSAQHREKLNSHLAAMLQARV